MSGALPSAVGLFDAARAGGVEAVMDLLLNLPVAELVRLVGVLGFDPTGRVRKWKSAARLIAFIAEETIKRVQRNRVFLV